MRRAGDVLIVEDDPEIRKMLARLLASQGYAARVAINRDTALAALAERTPALVLLDKAIPGDSAAVLERLRLIAPPVPAVLMTASYRASLEYDAGTFVASFVKPFDVSLLLDCIEQYVLPEGQERAV